MKIIEALIAVILLIIIYKTAFYISKRINGWKQIISLKRVCGAEVKILRNPLFSLFKLSSKPDVAVEIGNTVYLLRLLNGKGASRHMHFASKQYYVTFSKMSISLGGLLNVGRKYKMVRGSGFRTTSRNSVKILPELEIPEKYKIRHEFDTRKIIPVLIINPVSKEVTYVTEQRNSIKAAYEGDDVYGQKIFTASTFSIYADRVKRENQFGRHWS